ncbi:MAG TPA: VRR-NUC domain-containing protein [Pseudolabrys sp.]
MKRRRARSEDSIQRAVVQHLQLRGSPGLVFVHVPNGGKRRPIEAAILQGLGVRAGASDLLLWHAGKSFALELKAPGGRASDAQLQFITDIERAGAAACIAIGLDAALRWLEQHGLLRGRAQP